MVKIQKFRLPTFKYYYNTRESDTSGYVPILRNPFHQNQQLFGKFKASTEIDWMEVNFEPSELTFYDTFCFFGAHIRNRQTGIFKNISADFLFRNPLCDDVDTSPAEPPTQSNTQPPINIIGGKKGKFEPYLMWRNARKDYEDGTTRELGELPDGYARFDEKWELVSFTSDDGVINNYNYSLKAIFNISLDYVINVAHWRTYDSYGTLDDYQRFQDDGWNVPPDWQSNKDALFTIKTSGKCTIYFGYPSPRYVVFENDLLQRFSTQPDSETMKILYQDKEGISQYSGGNIFYQENSLVVAVRNKVNNYKYKTDYGDGKITLIDEGVDFYGLYYTYRGIQHQFKYTLKSAIPLDSPVPPPKPKILPPPPPPPPRECCMSCCSSNNNNEDLLRLILKRIGSDSYPAVLPETLLTKGGKEAGGTTTVESLTELLGWYIKRFDEIIGQFELSVDIQNDEEKNTTVHLPNLAEALSEIFMLNFQTYASNQYIANMCTRLLIESGQSKQMEVKNHYQIQSLIDYLGFDFKEDSINTPLTFTPGANSHKNFLKNSTVDIPVTEFSGKQPFNQALQELLHAAAIIRAVHWRKLEKNDIGGQVLGYMNLYREVSQYFQKKEEEFDVQAYVNEIQQALNIVDKKDGISNTSS